MSTETTDDESLNAHFEREATRARDSALADVPRKLVELAVQIGDIDLAANVADLVAKAGGEKLTFFSGQPSSSEELVESLRTFNHDGPLCDDASLEREHAAQRLAFRGEYPTVTREFATRRLDRLIREGADARDVAYVLLIMRRLSAAEWQDALARMPLPLKRLALGEMLAMGWTEGDGALVLRQLVLDVLRPRVPDGS